VKAISFCEFGDADVLEYGDVDDPWVYADQVLIRVRAAGVNPLDAAVRAGWLQRAWAHFLPIVSGFDAAGEVAAVSVATTEFAPGDAVMTCALSDYVKHGTYAEFVPVPQRLVARMPSGLSFEQAAALPLSGLAALQSLRYLEVGPGKIVLVHAAAGGVGHLAVQLARELGADRVIGTASEHNHEFVRSLGAEPVAYGEGLASRLAAVIGGDGAVDAVLDPFGAESLDISSSVVRDPDHVVYLTASGAVERGGRVWASKPNRKDLEELANLVVCGKVHVHVEALPLERAQDAQRRIEERHVQGKLVLTV
jgi:NADPH:quinone reductase-like Zn-dependent oxidoreductase